MSETITLEANGADGEQMVPIPIAQLDVFVRSMRFAGEVLLAIDRNDTLSSAQIRSVARSFGLVNHTLDDDFETLLLAYQPQQDPEAGEDEPEHAQ